MSGDPSRPGEEEFHAWVDGQLLPERVAAVEAWLALNPAEAARVRSYRRQRERLRELMFAKYREAVPRRLAIVTLRAELHRRRLRLWRNLAASVLLLLVGGGSGWLARGIIPGRPALLATDAVEAHRTFVTEVRHPVEVPAAQEAHLITWLSNRLGQPLRVPDLASLGFHLVGGRLLPGADTPAAQFMFEDEAGVRLTLYLHRQTGGGTGFDIVDRDGVTGFRWYENGFGYVVLAATPRDRLIAVAETIYGQLR